MYSCIQRSQEVVGKLPRKPQQGQELLYFFTDNVKWVPDCSIQQALHALQHVVLKPLNVNLNNTNINILRNNGVHSYHWYCFCCGLVSNVTLEHRRLVKFSYSVGGSAHVTTNTRLPPWHPPTVSPHCTTLYYHITTRWYYSMPLASYSCMTVNLPAGPFDQCVKGRSQQKYQQDPGRAIEKGRCPCWNKTQEILLD